MYENFVNFVQFPFLDVCKCCVDVIAIKFGSKHVIYVNWYAVNESSLEEENQIRLLDILV